MFHPQQVISDPFGCGKGRFGQAEMTPEELRERIGRSGHGGDIDARMKKLGFSLEFIAANVLLPPAVSVSHVAMLWMGMPNKHDRKRTRELFGLLTELGLLAPSGDDENWRVSL